MAMVKIVNTFKPTSVGGKGEKLKSGLICLQDPNCELIKQYDLSQ